MYTSSKPIVELPSPRVEIAWMIAFAVMTMLVLGTIATLWGVPKPKVHDEFAYLLAADTFCSGKLTNATPAHAAHFESVHILVSPSYMSKYQPGTALVMGVAQYLVGSAYWGVAIVSAMASTVAYWAVIPFAGRFWAIVSGFVHVVSFGSIHYWAQSYWGGAMPFLGAMLVVGSYGWVRGGNQEKATWPMALGFAILLLTRPFEGAFLCAAVLGLVICHTLRIGTKVKVVIQLWLLPLALLLGGAVVFQMIYNQGVTGCWARLPYSEHWDQYTNAALFWFLPVDDRFLVRDHNNEFANQQRWEMEIQRYWQRDGIMLGLKNRAVDIVLMIEANGFYVAWIALCGCILRWRLPKDLVAIALISSIPVMIYTWLITHYLACVIAVLWITKFHLLSMAEKMGSRMFLSVKWVKPFVVAILLLSVVITFLWRHRPLDRKIHARNSVESFLTKTNGDHLLFVKRGQKFDPSEEWVYNLSDLQKQKIVWARYLTKESNAALAASYKDRRVWVVEPENGSKLREGLQVD